ncbi:hypothetical protein COU54_04535 [Candidatus Pacearchaeota archaeon CG10_big_fil_rev_8_21_14_0_10_31_24]|nr:MAG: hypothetical protein COU54_04535 [Candidatus Pacearchaeota archaeon CG10_big_fil_rev_8_21_14_0_10_31_24]
MDVETITKCRICGNQELISILDLGEHSLANRFPSANEPDPPKAPLVLVKCDDSKKSSNCGLVQLKHTVSPDELYFNHYGYRSGLNATMITHLQNLVKEVEYRKKLLKNDLVLDIGSNDATLLKSYSLNELLKLGMDPTGKQFQQFYSNEIMLCPDYFNYSNFRRMSPKKAKIITSIAMFYDLPNPISFVKDIKESLDYEGLWILEQSYMPLMLFQNSFDTVCHEHLEYYALKQIEWMVSRLGLRIVDVSFNNINGGSFRITVCHENGPYVSNIDKLQKITKQENEAGLDRMYPYEDFKEKVEEIKVKITNFLQNQKSLGKTTHVYGASTKGNTLLQYLKLNTDLISAAAERNPEKFGRRTPATNIPIISEEESRNAKPDNFIVLPWHFKEEFLKREKEYLNSGGKFIFPLPNFEVINSGGIVNAFATN